MSNFSGKENGRGEEGERKKRGLEGELIIKIL